MRGDHAAHRVHLLALLLSGHGLFLLGDGRSDLGVELGSLVVGLDEPNDAPNESHEEAEGNRDPESEVDTHEDQCGGVDAVTLNVVIVFVGAHCSAVARVLARVGVLVAARVSALAGGQTAVTVARLVLIHVNRSSLPRAGLGGAGLGCNARSESRQDIFDHL